MEVRDFKTDIKAKTEILRMETRALFPYLIEITVDNEVFRYVNLDEDVTFENHIFTASFFKITPPERTQSSIKDASITISAIDGEWIYKIRNTNNQAKIRFVGCIIYEENNERYIDKIDDVTLKLTEASWNDTTITWKMQYDNLLNVNYPFVRLTNEIAPGLF